MNDWQYSHEQCPKCGQTMAEQDCNVMGCADGFIDEYEDDPINFMEGESYERCSECRGTGGHRWCRECGWDDVFNRFLSPEYKQDWLVKEALAGRAGDLHRCGPCEGSGTMKVTGFINRTSGCQQVQDEPMPCLKCSGTGQISDLTFKVRRVFDYVRQARGEMRIKQREQAEILGMTFSELNDLQHGKINL